MLSSGGKFLHSRKGARESNLAPLIPDSLRRTAEVHLNASGSSVADGYFSTFNDDRDTPLTSRIFQHLLKILGVFFCVAVVNFVAFLGVVLTGRLSVRSANLTVDSYDLLRSHLTTLLVR